MAQTLLVRLRNFEFNSVFVRGLLSVYFRPGKRYRVWWGPLLGRTLEYAANVNFHMMLGVWETASYRFLRNLVREGIVKRGAVIVDMGANLGYFSLWADRVVGREGRVIAFEPSPSILPLLKRNLAANAIQNVEVVELACSDQIGEVEFFVGDHHHISSLDGAWASQGKGRLAPISVGSTTLDAFFYGTKAAPRLPDLIKIDIEGGGVFALKGMDRCLSESRPLVWIESHTPHEDRAISQMILKHGYQAFRLQTGKRVMEPQTTYPNPEGVWGTMLLFPNEKEPVLKRVLL